LDIFLVNIINSKTLSELRGHFGPVNWLEWFKDGSGFVSAGSEGIIRVYRFDQAYFEEERFN
jgi:WD40 repeat protein